ncbi:hypothetical protein UFOVP84_207 [uncultured Caudovirales phage]|uniref:Uncharacterized protein n=1 Tax=uncultured Caudovirales phage TaxID=2100421 RepID=A0A6J5KY44_9CAUD|nr:hypothetical protein UFOVP84_207 [uncultured Caudovirales phage]
MSYSRWIHSNWYSFYHSTPVGTPKEGQILSLWHVTEHHDFTYKQLLSMGEGKLRSLYPEATDDDIIEAMDIIKQFKKDVNNEFSGDDLK